MQKKAIKPVKQNKVDDKPLSIQKIKNQIKNGEKGLAFLKQHLQERLTAIELERIGGVKGKIGKCYFIPSYKKKGYAHLKSQYVLITGVDDQEITTIRWRPSHYSLEIDTSYSIGMNLMEYLIPENEVKLSDVQKKLKLAALKFIDEFKMPKKVKGK